MLRERLPLYEKLEAWRNSKVVTYVTGDRPKLETQIHSEALDHFVDHLDLIGPTKKVSLYLYTRGGDTLAAWSLANLLRQFCDELEVIVPAKAHSAGTLLCLSANNIVMTKQATLGPIDPSVNGPLNPQVPGANPGVRVPVSVEAINGFVEFVRGALGPGDGSDGLAQALNHLATQIHPLVLGNAFRGRAQIRMLAKRLIARQIQDEQHVERVLNFLCSESGSHDYTIYRREAAGELGLKVEKPDADGYKLIKEIYDDINQELELSKHFDPNILLSANNPAPYSLRRSLIETRGGGCHVFLSEGRLLKQQLNIQGMVQDALSDERLFEGWKHEPAA